MRRRDRSGLYFWLCVFGVVAIFVGMIVVYT